MSALVVAALFANGAWQRRWIADDGLIVLRTVRNLLAGNGPVFNEGERVEANTSTAWTYLIWFWSWLTGGQVEYVVLWIALVLSVTAVPLAMWGTMRMLGVSLRSAAATPTVVLPLGALVYIALPPARDFATSGLEVSLCIFWVATLWWQVAGWSRRGPLRTRADVAALLALAFTGGLAPLVRPELAIVGALVLALVVVTEMSWRLRTAFVATAAVLPLGYQIFRMGYYGLLVPNTAVAKDATGSKWQQGFTYLGNMFSPYTLALPLIVAVVAALSIWLLRRRGSAPDTSGAQPARVGRWAAGRARLQTPAAVTTVMLLGGLIEVLYWLRQGGDFMHSRVLLVPLFILLLPVMIIPLVVPESIRRPDPAQLLGAASALAFFVITAIWAIGTSHSAGMRDGTEIGRSGIVDERRYYIQNLGVTHPITAQDYLNYPRMRAMVDEIEQRRDGGVLLPSADYDKWNFIKLAGPRVPGTPPELTVFFLNLGMTSMNAPLNVRVVDQMGLAYPIASHTERLEDARIGHDKDLPGEWVVAESGGITTRPLLPLFLDPEWARDAGEALTCPQTRDLIASYKAPLTLTRFRNNLRQSFDFTSYRIERVPRYELMRCRLPLGPPIP
ncbi:hypothetical protein KIK15_12470 [Williamsia sp. CHRR-6]|nr:hypothetical protein [Williamsia sp. CHRR-6]